jgi:glucose/arabinose dehydrogenase/4-amino-4-deoxy-L-arabinose transferase-like glycosyltransferase
MRSPRWGEVLLVAAIMALALAVRLPYLWDIPRFTDETAEARIGLRITNGEVLPLANRDPYIGALWNYLLAAGFLVSGPSLFTPRAIMVIAGALTILPTYLLGRAIVQAPLAASPPLAPLPPGSASEPGREGEPLREAPDRVGQGQVEHLSGPIVGGAAALLLALAPAHIAVNSHIAWSNCLTPLFTTIGLWLASLARARARPMLLVPAGLAFGLGAQTHPTGVLLLPGVAIAVAIARPRWLLAPWPWLAVLAALVGCANLLLANVQSGGAGLATGAAVQEQYTGGELLTPWVYQDRVRQELLLLTDSLSGTLVETGPLSGPLVRPLGMGLLLATVAGVEALGRRRSMLTLLAVVSYLLLLPIVNGRYESSVPKARYIAPLLPICYLAIAVLLEESRARIAHLRGKHVRPFSPVLYGGIAAVALVLAIGPLLGLAEYYRAAQQDGRTNAPFYQTVRAIEDSLRPGERVYVERELLQQYTLGGGQWNEHLLFAGTVDGWQRIPFEMPGALAPSVPRIVGPMVVRGTRAAAAEQVYRVDPVASGPPDGAPARVFYTSGTQPMLATARREQARPATSMSKPRAVPFISGVTFPSALTFAPDGRVFFVQVMEGKVRIASAQGDLQREPFVTLPATKGLEQGVLGLALDPEFAKNHWVYVFYSEADANNRPVRNRLIRFTDVDGHAEEATAILGDLPINTTNNFNGGHNGGRLLFGRDGKLYVSIGEMVHRSAAADPRQPFGKILRINKDGSIPDDNPFGPYAAYALGFRNVFGFAFHPVTGQLYATDNGPRGFDELNLVLPGRNYGFPTVDGVAGIQGLEDPIWDSDEERLGITGTTFYTGVLFPEYRNNLFFCAFTTGALRRVVLGGPALDQVDLVETIANDCRLDVADGPDGSIYYSDLARIYRLVP